MPPHKSGLWSVSRKVCPTVDSSYVGPRLVMNAPAARALVHGDIATPYPTGMIYQC